MTLIDFPQPVQAEEYELAVQQLVKTLSVVPGVRSIYQIGHVSTPGISDLDLLIVLDPGAQFAADPRVGLPATARYLLVHRLFAVSEGDFPEAVGLSFFHNYRLQWGQPQGDTPWPRPSPEEEAVLKRQVALEYMVGIYVSLFVELTYGIVKVRNLLLHAKALLYDCEFLNVRGGDFRAAADRLVDRRNSWFNRNEPRLGLVTEATELCRTLGSLLQQQLREHEFFLPTTCRNGGRLARHLNLRYGTEIGIVHRGPRLPAFLAAVSTKYVNLLNRLNRFDIAIPFATADIPPIIQRAFDLRVRLIASNRQACPHFMALSNGLCVR